ncbi:MULTISPECIES: NAD(P)-dependent oxidoreductase [Paraburkholderia]|uniref:NAD(P)-dependent oxidoreductase n=1 Tax=Paraburkholderia TaxID=1822464 RepID=UPI00038099C8|nr:MULTISPECIES: NAD(P)-dependent oxidoreductase [Paraburkholderia]MDH6147358.1 2-hydroxy-3-oxopropionate reductase [Paraburkholderia sp. WSM4179]
MKVAVIGVGVMGSAIATRLIQTGAEVTVFDAFAGKLGPLVSIGATAAESAATATRNADFVITSLNSAAIVEKAVFGPNGIAAEGSTDKLLIDMSSIDAGRTSEMAARLREQSGMGWVDAPLSGGAPAALQGTLTLMVGGTEQDVKHAEPLLAQLAARFTRFGEAGAGQTVKLINQVLCAAGFMAVAEAVRFAEQHGVDASKIPGALAGGRADSRILQEFMGKMAVRDFTPTGRIDNMLKDLETVQASAMARRIPMPVTSVITDLHRMLVAGGFGAADSAEYMRLFRLGKDEV